MPSFWIGDWELKSEPRPPWEKLRLFFAEARRLLALLLIPLLRRFFSVEPPASLRSGGLPLPLRFSPLAIWSAVRDFVGTDSEELGLEPGEGDLSGFESVSWLAVALFELPPNILFSRPPPWEERLRRLLPASFVERVENGVSASFD